MKFEKCLFNVSLANNSIDKYTAGEKIVLVHEYKQKEAGRVVFDSEDEYETAIDNALIDENDIHYNTVRALGSVLDIFFDTNILG